MNTNSKARAFTDRHASIDELDRSIVNLAVQLNRITHDFLVLVRRFDEWVGWLRWGCESCAEWLHYRCDISNCAGLCGREALLFEGAGADAAVRRIAYVSDLIVLVADGDGNPLWQAT